MNFIKLVFTIGIAALAFWDGVLIHERIVHAQTPPVTTPWFSVTIGETTCRVSKVAQTPIRVSYLCFNPYGASAGSYTADATGGTAAPNQFILELNSMAPAVSPSAVTCMIAMNGTAAPINAGSLGTVPASSATYSCTGLTGSTISWP
jgi:hypothetical protein